MSFTPAKARAFFVLLLSFAAFSLLGQDISISGTVTGEDEGPLIGATVNLQGTTKGVITDLDGRYSIEVPSESAVLVFSYVGYSDREIEVGGRRSIDIELTTNTNQLEEVVVTGYGTQQKQDVTGSISSVKGEAIGNLPVAGASQALQGRAAGVQVVRNGGAPGSGGSIRIRGTGTVNNADPLIVIDGVPLAFGSINDINPNDIESIEVLKDASSSAIYGQRAANGVVLITTKKGGFGEDISITLNGYGGVSNAINTIEVLDAPTLAELKRERYTNDGLDANPIWNESAFQVQRTDWQEELLGTGVVQNYDLTVRGGGQKSSFAITGGYFKDDGMIKQSFYERIYARVNSEHRINNWLTLGENLQLTRQSDNFINTNSAQTGILWSAIRFHPGLPVIVEEPLPGHEIGQYGSSQVSGEFGDINNPIFTVDQDQEGERVSNRLLGNVFADIQIFDGLNFRANFALDGGITNSRRFFPIIDQQIRARARNELDQSTTEFSSLLGEYFLTFDKVLGERHAVKAVAGYTAQKFVSEGFSAERLDFPNEDPDQRFLSTGNTISGASGGKSENSLVSAFGRLNYSFDQKYLLTATFRADGSSRFAPGNKWGYFPAVSAGWRISREGFFGEGGLISFLQVNAGWGQLGNQNVADLQYLALVSSGRRYSFGGEQVVGASLSRIPNENISWETAEMLNFGVDFGLIDNRLLGNISYFIKDTKDMLLAPPTVGSIGRASVPDQNVGEMRNQGLEIELGYQNRAGRDFTYNISGNASFITNEVTKLFDGNFLASRRYGRPNQEIARTFEGEPIGTFFGWRTDGLYQTQDEINADANIADDPRKENGQIQPGDVRFLDLNGDGLIDDNDRTIIGNPHPDVSYGLNAGISYKGFDVNLFFLGVAGVDIYNADRMQGIDPTYPFNLYAETENRWTGPGTSNSIPRMTTRRDNLNYRTSDLFVENGSFFRLKNLTLGYTLPPTLTERIGVRNLRFYITGQNVFTVTDYSGMDPEPGYVDGNLQLNVDYAQYPQARTWTFGLTAGF